MRAERLRRRFLAQLGPRAAAVQALVRAVEALGERAYLVGGPVRDLALGRPVFAGDVDLLVTGSLERLLEQIDGPPAWQLHSHPRFLTATLRADDFRVDLAQPRRERYARPGALPDVEPAALEEDFARRDFTIHAMALPLHAAAGERVLDPHGGLADLAARQLRTLHAASFADDPTRLLRAGRYAARLGLRLERGTRRAFDAALAAGALDTLSGERILHELERLLLEPDPARAARWLERHAVWRALDRSWRLDPAAERGLRRLARARALPPWPEAGAADVQRACGLGLLLLGQRPAARGRTLARLGVAGRPAESLLDALRALPGLARFLAGRPSPGRLDARLAGWSEPGLLLAHCALGAPALRRYASLLRPQRAPLDGHAARALGLAGPAIGALLRDARARALDGLSVDDAWQRRWLARHARMD